MHPKSILLLVRRATRAGLAAALLLALLVGAPARPAEAATLLVDTTLDSADIIYQSCNVAVLGDCTLRGAVLKAGSLPGMDTITLPAGTYILTLGPLQIRSSLFLNGEDQTNTFIDGNLSSTVMIVGGDDDPIVNMSDITIQNGRGGASLPGGGLFVLADAYASLTRSTVRNNRTNAPGGGIANGGTLQLVEVTLRDNRVPIQEDVFDTGGTQHSGGGLMNFENANATVIRSAIVNNYATRGGGIRNAGGHLELINSTVSGNRSFTRGGGLMNFGTAWLAYSTVANNETQGVNDNPGLPSGGGGIYNHGVGLDGVTVARVDLGNSIVAGNRDLRGASDPEYSPDCYSADPSKATSFRGNLVGVVNENCNLKDTIFGDDASFDQTGTEAAPLDARLNALADNGGLTLTHSLQDNSPALDRGTGITSATFFDCPETDQRGAIRPRDGDGDGDADCDVGAFEAPSAPIDDFTLGDHPGGRLNGDWLGSRARSDYRVTSEGLDVENGGPLYWARQTFGADQQAFMTFARVDAQGLHQSLLLKVQGNSWRSGLIAVFYNAVDRVVGIETYVPGVGWRILTTQPAELHDGDQLGARARADGSVTVYVNGLPIATAEAGSLFAGKGGRVGMWFINATGAVVDDFSGATITP